MSDTGKVSHWSKVSNPFDNSDDEDETSDPGPPLQLKETCLDDLPSLKSSYHNQNASSKLILKKPVLQYKSTDRPAEGSSEILHRQSSSNFEPKPNSRHQVPFQRLSSNSVLQTPTRKKKESGSSSESEESSPSQTSQSSQYSTFKQLGSWQRNSFKISPTSKPMNFARSASFRSRPNPTGTQRVSLVHKTSELSSLGSFKPLEKKTSDYKLISKYILNSTGVPEEQVEIHSIHQMTKGGLLEKTFKEKNNLILFCKTTNSSVLNLGLGLDGCVAFYDRICRALSVKVDNLEKPHRQIILLCSVSLGNVHEHKSGYKIWALRNLPESKNSVKGIGRFIPAAADYGQNDILSSAVVPSGNTMENTRYSSYDLEYNEYIVYHSNQVQVKFAVDIEITPGRGKY